MTSLFLALLLGTPAFAGPPAASAPADVWVKVTTAGRDGRGESVFDEFELLPDGRASWNTNSLGAAAAGCGLSAGKFEVQVPPEPARRLGALAAAAVKSQPVARSGGKPRQVRRSVFVDLGGKVSQESVTRATPEWEALLKAVTELQITMRPTSAVTMRAHPLPGPGRRVKAEFLWAASDPLLLQVPAEAADAFSAPGYNVSFSGPPRPLREVRLGEDRRSFSVELLLSPNPATGVKNEPPRLYYTNQVIQHHGEADPLEGRATAPPASLCASLPPASL